MPKTVYELSVALPVNSEEEADVIVSNSSGKEVGREIHNNKLLVYIWFSEHSRAEQYANTLKNVGIDVIKIIPVVKDGNPHNRMIRLGDPPYDFWACTYCDETGTFDELRGIECGHQYPPCKYCGQTPTCALDCRGIQQLFEDLADDQKYE